MVRKTKQEALATRSSLLDAAERLFQQHGVSRTTLHDIAQAAGVTRGAVYWHFKDKGELFTAMLDRACLPLEEAAAQSERDLAVQPLQHLRERLLDVLRRVATEDSMRRVAEIASHKVEYVDELLVVRDRLLQVRADHLAHMERALRAAQRQGLLVRSPPVRTIALGLHALIDGLIQNWMLDPAAFDLLRTGRQTLDTYLAGLKSRETGAARPPLAAMVRGGATTAAAAPG